MTADCNRATPPFSSPATSAIYRTTPPAAAARRASASRSNRNVLASVATGGGQRHVASFPAIRAIVETVGAKAYVVLSFADGAVPFTGAALFRQVALRAMGRTLHGASPENST